MFKENDIVTISIDPYWRRIQINRVDGTFGMFAPYTKLSQNTKYMTVTTKDPVTPKIKLSPVEGEPALAWRIEEISL